jgi:putative flippase GtrA
MKQIHKFLLLGVVSTLIDYVVYSVLIFAGVDYVAAIIAGYGMGLLANYQIGRRYIFTSGVRVSSTRTEFLAVVVIALFGALFNIAIVKLLSYSIWQIDPMISRIVAIGIVFFWNYFARKVWVYH